MIWGFSPFRVYGLGFLKGLYDLGLQGMRLKAVGFRKLGLSGCGAVGPDRGFRRHDRNPAR